MHDVMKRSQFFLLSILIYILTFIIIYHYVKRGMPTAVVIPVFAAGLLYGRRSGAVAALCAVPANIFLCMLMGLDWKDLAFFDETKNEWVTEPGEFKILVGSSSRDIRLKDTIEYT